MILLSVALGNEVLSNKFINGCENLYTENRAMSQAVVHPGSHPSDVMESVRPQPSLHVKEGWAVPNFHWKGKEVSDTG